MKKQSSKKSQCNSKKNKDSSSGRYQDINLYSNENSMVLAKRQTKRLTKQNRKAENTKYDRDWLTQQKEKDTVFS